ncbi:QueT transporter family protein [Ligilactobacillus ceti]|uniref:QueT transporter family protein n=1 Tax=Ligilactobacillus ceti DSM 22408 TaxID=1122146 RepID=A0A0R2KU60_9LACO|nr:QueT transporter family protein [Ligilactobacillus ceti]KRN89805.1 hypothetical protein IV53_GL001132 [Ligilactobacillus ceti DSM 22408]
MDNVSTHTRLVSVTKAALVTGLYVALTMLFAPLSFGAIQIRFAEIFNNLAIFNKRYIWAVTLGCIIANFWSSMGLVDVVFGSIETLLMTSISYYLSQKVKQLPAKFAIVVIICTLSSWIIGLELYYVLGLPFWFSYLTVAIGEFISVALGAVIFWAISKKVDLTA